MSRFAARGSQLASRSVRLQPDPDSCARRRNVL